ncbi:octaprenyl-diphosphate synthase [Francisella sp. Scap27]|uniref:polyprenyl synthetase family protein n=1 Tax=Francisella sp. Scap27 TaxID=2589986 RepID=UPI0015BD3ECB|nr:farnesyl diphosphate synthase [Francisella sp. Scap27]QLE79534.1 octaprenyl-diphosphate synthase [Francisella sp. Scap27]
MSKVKLEIFDNFAKQYFNELKCPSSNLINAMKYSFFSGGKRIRAQLVYIVSEMFGVSIQESNKIAFAIEAIHTYSLIHDDLPAMDNDSLRRGIPTCHIKYNDATAILAGDALQSIAFKVLQDLDIKDVKVLKKVNSILADCSGTDGMVAGQQLDIDGENSNLDIDNLKIVHINKTAKMFCASMLIPYTVSNNYNKNIAKTLEHIAVLTGLCFQIKDDILDVTKSTKELGKTSAKDISSNKSTYVSLLGIEKANELLNTMTYEILESIMNIESSSVNCSKLKNIIKLVINRNH